MKKLQALALRNELRFEVSKQTALAFIIKRMPEDLLSLAASISERHGIVSRQQVHRLDVAYCSFAAAAAATAGRGIASGGGGFLSSAAAAADAAAAAAAAGRDIGAGTVPSAAGDASHDDGDRQTSTGVQVWWLLSFPHSP